MFQTFLDLAVQNSTEGLIVKTLDCSYEPSKRSVNWLKLKKDYLEGLGDSFDLVVIGAWHGKGKRTGVFGSYLLAVFDPVSEEFQSISKIGTGFSEEDLEKHTQALKEIQINSRPLNYKYELDKACCRWREMCDAAWMSLSLQMHGFNLKCSGK